MQFLLVVAMLCASTIFASAEEAYQRTTKILGTCLGQQMRLVREAKIRISPDALDNQLKRSCGHLEEQEQKEYIGFLKQKIDHTFTAEMALTIILYTMLPPEKGREMAVQAYKCAMGFDKNACIAEAPSK